MSESLALSPDRFFTGFLAGLKLVHSDRLSANRTALNRAFYRTLKSPAASFFDADALDVDYDPLYGVSPWFERQLTRAQRDLLVSFPNPSYSAVDVKLKAENAERLLATIGHKEHFLALARVFLEHLADAR